MDPNSLIPKYGSGSLILQPDPTRGDRHLKRTNKVQQRIYRERERARMHRGQGTFGWWTRVHCLFFGTSLLYCLSKKSRANLYSNWLYKFGHDLLDIMYVRVFPLWQIFMLNTSTNGTLMYWTPSTSKHEIVNSTIFRLYWNTFLWSNPIRDFEKGIGTCVYIKSCPIFIEYSQCKNGQDFLGIQYFT